MIYENEIVMLIFGIVVVIFIGLNYQKLKSLESIKILLTGFCLFFCAWVFSTAEGFFLENILNFFEHACYAAGAIVVLRWLYTSFNTSTGKN